MILADGHISIRPNRIPALVMRLAARDAAHVVALRSFLRFDGKVSEVPVGSVRWRNKVIRCNGAAIINIRSERIVARLAEIGVLPLKSAREQMPDELATCPHAWRGYCDGDGWVAIYKRPSGTLTPVIGVCGSETICRQFSEFARTVTKNTATVIRNNTIFSCQVTGTGAIKLASSLYAIPGPALRRKQIVARAMLAADWNQFQFVRSVDHGQNRLVTIGGETKNVADWCRTLGLNIVTIYGRLGRGEAPEVALSRPTQPRRSKVLEHDGHVLTLRQWSEKLSVPYTTLHQRLRLGWSPREILFGKH